MNSTYDMKIVKQVEDITIKIKLKTWTKMYSSP